MSRVISTTEGEPITEDDNGVVHWKSKAAIDGDGSGPSHGDPDFQNDTSLHYNGKPLNADLDPYIVVPPAIVIGVAGIVLGCQGYVTFRGHREAVVVGDIGPHRKLGEIAIATAKAVGIPSSPTSGGEDDHDVYYEIHPGVPATVVLLDGTTRTYALQRS